MSEDIERELGTLFNNCLMNLYADGSGSMGFHSTVAFKLSGFTASERWTTPDLASA